MVQSTAVMSLADLETTAARASTTSYTDSFYTKYRGPSERSASRIVPLVLSLVPVKSVIDVGCGIGPWVAEFIEHGVTDVLGIDGDYVNRQLLRFPSDRFAAYDLREPIHVDRQFDLAVSVEVAEHLPASRAASFVHDLTRLSRVILFSAAVPGQGGTDHINEQYLSYWVDLFAAREYELLDVIRPSMWRDGICDWVYRQNAVIFAHKDEAIVPMLRVPSGIDYIHPVLHDRINDKLANPTVGYLLNSIPGSIRRSFRTRLRRAFLK